MAYRVTGSASVPYGSSGTFNATIAYMDSVEYPIIVGLYTTETDDQGYITDFGGVNVYPASMGRVVSIRDVHIRAISGCSNYGNNSVVINSGTTSGTIKVTFSYNDNGASSWWSQSLTLPFTVTYIAPPPPPVTTPGTPPSISAPATVKEGDMI